MGFLDFVSRIYRKITDEYSYLNIPTEKAIVEKLEYDKGPSGEKVLRRAYLVVPNDIVLKKGDHYRDKDGKKHIHHGANKYARIWPNRVEIFDFQNIRACMDFVKRLGSKWIPETARYDHGEISFSKPGFVSLPLDIMKVTKPGKNIAGGHFISDKKMGGLLLNRAIQTIAMAQGLERVYFGKGIPKSLQKVYLGADRKIYGKKEYIKLYDTFVPKDSPKLQSATFRKKLAKKLDQDRFDILKTMNRYSTPGNKLSKLRNRIEVAELTNYEKVRGIVITHVIPKKTIIVAKKLQEPAKTKMARR